MAYQATFAGLQQAVKDILYRPAFPQDMLESSIHTSQERLERKLRIPLMEKVVSETFTGGDFPVPTDLIEVKNFVWDGYPSERVMPEDIQKALVSGNARASGGAPVCFARFGPNFIFAPVAQDGMSYELWYYARQPVLTAPATSNKWLADGWDAMLYGSLTAAGELIADDRVQQWETRYVQAASELKDEGYDLDYKGSVLHVPAPGGGAVYY